VHRAAPKGLQVVEAKAVHRVAADQVQPKCINPNHLKAS